MIRINKWGGWVSSASPYILPPGGSVEQVNVQSRTPGQLSVRGGMAPVKGSTPVSGAILEMWGYSIGSGSTETVFVFTDSGDIVQVKSPEISVEP